MKKLYFKFALALVLLINTIVIFILFEELVYVIEPYLFPLFFLYFIVDSFSVMFPRFNGDIYSSKMEKSNYIEVPNYDKERLKEEIKHNNRAALLIFILYALLITVIGLLYVHITWIDRKYIYLVFFGLNFADYFCIMLWCPFRSWFLKNSCCNTCRISNWDRIMKFSILIFIPNLYTITIFILGVLIFLYWEYHHFMHPERFYRVSNKLLWCTNCDKVTCGKQKRNS